MGTGLEIALISGAIAGTASAGYSIYQGEQQKKKAEEQEGQMKAEADRLMKEKKEKDAQMESAKVRDSQLAKLKANQMARGATGRSDTIKTGSLGLTDSGAGASGNKSLLGM
jgi:uncharacterized protein HemX